MTALPEAAVVDTSVLLRFFVAHDDADQEIATRVFEAWRHGDVTLHVLDLSAYEMSNVLVRRMRVPADKAGIVMERLFRIRMRMLAVHRTLARFTVEIATETGLSGYDAAFVAAGRTLGMAVITADRRMASLGGDRVLLLADLAA